MKYIIQSEGGCVAALNNEAILNSKHELVVAIDIYKLMHAFCTVLWNNVANVVISGSQTKGR